MKRPTAFFLGQGRHLTCSICLTLTTPYTISLHPPVHLALTIEANEVHHDLLICLVHGEMKENYSAFLHQPCFLTLCWFPCPWLMSCFVTPFLKCSLKRDRSHFMLLHSHLNTVYAPLVCANLETIPAVPSKEKYIKPGLFSWSSWEIRCANPFPIMIRQTAKLTLTHKTLLQEWSDV